MTAYSDRARRNMNALEKFIAFFVKRHLLTNLIFVIVFIGGIFAWQNTSKEQMPDIQSDHARVLTTYPGATAEEVEHFLTKPIEDKVKGLDGVYRVTSTSSDGSSSVNVEFEQGYPDIDEAVIELRNAVLDVNLPDDVIDDPEVRVWKSTKMAIIDIMLIDTTRHLLDINSRKRLQEYAYALEQQLLNLPEITAVDKSGYLQEEMQILVNPERLRKFDIPFNTVMNEVRNNHVRQPAGNIETKSEPKVTLLSELDTVSKLNDLIVQGGFEGQVVRLQEVADIRSGFKKTREIIKVNGHEAVMLRAVKSSSYGILEALDVVKTRVDDFRRNNLADTGIQVVSLDDESVDLKNRLSLIIANGSIGFVLILIMLFIFLDFRSGIWVALGIPFTLCFAMICAAMMGYTINNITLAAVIIVLGMIVDDAIVVSENITRLRAENVPSEEAVVRGTAFVFAPIVASILTTCIAFVPLFFFRAHFGRMLVFIPPIIFFMLGASLFESLFILPGHMELRLPLLTRLTNLFSRRGRPKNARHWFQKVEDSYGNFLEKILPYKWGVFAAFTALLIFSGYIVKTKMSFVMFPREETREITLNGEAPPDKDRFDTALITRDVENVIAPYIGKEVIGFRTQIARSRRGRAVEENKFRIDVEIVPKQERKKSADSLIAEWEAQFKTIAGLTKLETAKSRWGHDSGSPIELIVQENDDATRNIIAEQLAEYMKTHPALQNVEIERPLENPEYKVNLKREEIKRLSINPSGISTTLRAALAGVIIYNLPKGSEEIDVRFTISDETKDDIEKILDIPIGNSRDYLVPLRDIVDVRKTVAPNSIERKDSKRVTAIYADLKEGAGVTPVDIAKDLEASAFPRILKQYPTTFLNFEGEIKDTRESTGDFRNAIIMATALIYIVLVLLLNSLTKPLIIMLAIPFGAVGIVLAFWLHGKSMFGFFAAIGTIGLAGVVVNDAIIMIAKLERTYDTHKARDASNQQISAIAKTRLRAVMLTTLTTVAGLLPTAYGFTGYDAMLAEMMLALTWGLIFGTTITLILIPCTYSFSKDIGFWISRLRGRLSH
jgi:multidrug efflux pump subunit AcrB